MGCIALAKGLEFRLVKKKQESNTSPLLSLNNYYSSTVRSIWKNVIQSLVASQALGCRLYEACYITEFIYCETQFLNKWFS